MSKIIRINTETEIQIDKLREKIKKGEPKEIQDIIENMSDSELIKMAIKFIIDMNLVKN